MEQSAPKSKLNKLSEDSLTKQPEEVLDVLEKLGEGSYGSVYKAIHKESGQVVAIKQVPCGVGPTGDHQGDLHNATALSVIRGFVVALSFTTPYVVKYYGSYFKNTDLWIVMEYCGARLRLPTLIRLRNKTVGLVPLSHDLRHVSCLTRKAGYVYLRSDMEFHQVTCTSGRILRNTLKYLHFMRKIHRDIKAGNILLNTEGHAKASGLRGRRNSSRRSVYNCVADIWSLGITSIEMAEGKKSPRHLHDPNQPSPDVQEARALDGRLHRLCEEVLVKNPEQRATATQLLQHPFISQAKPVSILRDLITEAME
ncbi:Serine/threonine-protein kinase 3 [Merluccius polli]|uniref:non-specific serine/threonine protein kinase n=1 Tax=Merluccius polli TaxID=89951 RepID=A0AA47MI34_MERPO|nr:Serine/threonine-protein kinase 3 [Merluccius polli]